MNSLDQGLIIALIPQVNSVSNIIGISFLQEKHRFWLIEGDLSHIFLFYKAFANLSNNSLQFSISSIIGELLSNSEDCYHILSHFPSTTLEYLCKQSVFGGIFESFIRLCQYYDNHARYYELDTLKNQMIEITSNRQEVVEMECKNIWGLLLLSELFGCHEVFEACISQLHGLLCPHGCTTELENSNINHALRLSLPNLSESQYKKLLKQIRGHIHEFPIKNINPTNSITSTITSKEVEYVTETMNSAITRAWSNKSDHINNKSSENVSLRKSFTQSTQTDSISNIDNNFSLLLSSPPPSNTNSSHHTSNFMNKYRYKDVEEEVFDNEGLSPQLLENHSNISDKLFNQSLDRRIQESLQHHDNFDNSTIYSSEEYISEEARRRAMERSKKFYLDKKKTQDSSIKEQSDKLTKLKKVEIDAALARAGYGKFLKSPDVKRFSSDSSFPLPSPSTSINLTRTSSLKSPPAVNQFDEELNQILSSLKSVSVSKRKDILMESQKQETRSHEISSIVSPIPKISLNVPSSSSSSNSKSSSNEAVKEAQRRASMRIKEAKKRELLKKKKESTAIEKKQQDKLVERAQRISTYLERQSSSTKKLHEEVSIMNDQLDISVSEDVSIDLNSVNQVSFELEQSISAKLFPPTPITQNQLPHGNSSTFASDTSTDEEGTSISLSSNIVTVHVIRAWDLMEGLGGTNPYIVIDWGTLGRQSTQTIQETTEPMFKSFLRFMTPLIYSSDAINTASPRQLKIQKSIFDIIDIPMMIYIFSRNASCSDELLGQTMVQRKDIIASFHEDTLSCRMILSLLDGNYDPTAGCVEINISFDE